MKHILDIINENKNESSNYVDIFVCYKDEILYLRRANYLKFNRGKWCIPGGSVDSDERCSDASVRELKEETNITISDPKFLFRYEYNNGKITSVYKVELNEKPKVKISREHAQYKWLTFDQVFKMKEKFPSETFEIINKYMNSYEKSN